MDGTIGEIRLFAATFTPRSWAFCMGQLVAIQSNTALYAILGTTYGGNGSTTFGLPNFAGRVAIGAGSGGGLSTYVAGESLGSNTTTLLTQNLPNHSHVATATVSIPAYPDYGEANTPSGNILATKTNMYNSTQGDDNMKTTPFNMTLAPVGSNIPLSVTQPSIGMNFIICLVGEFPSRN
ncbi:phage tail protein [Flavobacterium foetidum]|uniref:phage tail protein n=1 Tax=Flavobacterium foetidum TaxID=2026681 RepID=UPI00107512D5|nr:tail fiber protein [Flavobacterium foetidum]KAF2514949.1 phage tail protein [Flavobacterium foetidum]